MNVCGHTMDHSSLEMTLTLAINICQCDLNFTANISKEIAQGFFFSEPQPDDVFAPRDIIVVTMSPVDYRYSIFVSEAAMDWVSVLHLEHGTADSTLGTLLTDDSSPT